MKHIKLLSFISCLLLFGACQTHKKQDGVALKQVHIIDRNGISETISETAQLKKYSKVDFLKDQPYKKVLRVYSKNEEGKTFAKLTSYHPNGAPYQYLEVLGSRAHGWYREWHSNGAKKIHAKVIGGIADLDPSSQRTWMFDDVSYVWDPEGNLKAEIRYSRGALDGTSKYFSKTGSLTKVVPYNAGKIEGEVQEFFDNGTLKAISSYALGRLAGETKEYWRNEELAVIESYSNGLLIDGSYYSSTGELVSSVQDGNGQKAIFGAQTLHALHTYEDGKEEGEVQEFNSEGHLLKTYALHNEEKVGEEIEYYPVIRPGSSPQPRLSLYWDQGKLSGEAKTWYPTGQIESRREFHANQKQGLHTAWYEDGSLMLVEEYERDKLASGKYFAQGKETPSSEVINGKGVVTLFDGKGSFKSRFNYEEGLPTQ